MLAAAGMCLVMTGAAQAKSVWDVFHDRCLVPMEGVTGPDLTGLPDPRAISEEPLGLMSGMVGREYVIEGLPAILVVTDDGLTCMVIQTDSQGVDSFAAAEAWADNSRTSGRYEDIAAIQMGVRNFNLGSTEWREPRLDVFGASRDDGERPFFYVVETDLEV